MKPHKYKASLGDIESKCRECGQFYQHDIHASEEAKCICPGFTSPHYHASDNPHSVEIQFACPVHGTQDRSWLIHKEKEAYCTFCNVPQEDWRKDYYELGRQLRIACPMAELPDKVESFITSTIQKEREKAHTTEGAAYDSGFARGKKVTLQSVRKMLESIISENDDGMWSGREILDNVLSKLSQLTKE